MLKKLGMAVLAAGFLLSVPQAKAEQVGVYVTPKFVYAVTNTKGKLVASPPLNESLSTGSLGNVAGGALAIGYDFHSRFSIPLRTELEYAAFGSSKSDKTYYDGDGDGTKLQNKVGIQSLFLNTYYDFHNSTDFTPYVGAGIGFGFVSNKASAIEYGYDSNTYGKKTKTNFAWNIGLGCAYDFNDYVSLDLGYRYAQLGKAESKTGMAGDVEDGTLSSAVGKTGTIGMHQFMLGLRVTF